MSTVRDVNTRHGLPALPREDRYSTWPAATRGVLAALVFAVATGLGVACQGLPRSTTAIVRAPDLRVDVNTVPSRVLGTLPHVGQTLVRQVVAAREAYPIDSLEDAGSRIRGLGPATLAQIAPYLRFDTAAARAADHSAVSLLDQGIAKPKAKRSKAVAPRRNRKGAPAAPRLVSRASEAGSL